MDTTTTPKCHRCHRVLRSESSVSRGYGPGCWAKIGATAKTVDAKPAQIEKARELIEVGGIIPIHKGRAFRVVASDGVSTYLAAPQACSCPAGLRGKYGCYHRVAATLMTAAKTTTHQSIAA